MFIASNYYLMHQNTPVAVLQMADKTGDILDIIKVLSPEHMPLELSGDCTNILSLRKWWRQRGIPASREGLELLLAAASAPSAEFLLLKCSGLSLTDQYWITPEAEPQDWHKVNFFENSFSDDIGKLLLHQSVSPPPLNLHDPSCSSDGNLQKQWKIINGQRILIKAGTAPFYQEPLNECIATALFSLLEIPHIEYSLLWNNEHPLSACSCFVDKDTEFVSAAAIMNVLPQNESSAFQHFLICCKYLGIDGAEKVVTQMLAADFILANTDRHLRNFGAIRRADTLEWHGIAPIFDSGTSLWQLDQTAFIPHDAYLPAKPFANTHHAQLALLIPKHIADMPLEKLCGFELCCQNILKQSSYIDDARANNISQQVKKHCEYLVSRYRGQNCMQMPVIEP